MSVETRLGVAASVKQGPPGPGEERPARLHGPWCKQHGIYDYEDGTTFERDFLPEVANTWVSDDIHMAKSQAEGKLPP